MIVLNDKIPFLLLLLLFSLTTTAQNRIDSLKNKLASEEVGKDQINTLQKLGTSYASTRPDSALIYYNRALKLCIAHNSAQKSADILNKKAILLIKQGNKEALEVLHTAKNLYTQLGDTLGIANIEKNLGNYYYYQKSLDKALKQYFLAYEMYDKLKDRATLSKILNNIAIIYRFDKKYERALEIYQQSLTIKRELRDSVGMGKTLMNMGSLQIYTNQKESFYDYFQHAQNIFDNLNSKALDAACHLAFGQGLLEFNELTTARNHLEKAFNYYHKYPHLHQYEVSLNLLGKTFMKTKEFKKAEELYETGLTLNRKNTRKVMLEAHLRSLSTAKFELKDYKAAFLLLEEAYLLQDSLKIKNKFAIAEEMQTKFDVRQKDATLKIQQLEIAKQKQSTQVFRLICGLLSLFIISGLYAFYQKNKHNQLLEAKNVIIESTLKEKDLLMKEIHHRVKNNLQFISSLLSLQSRHLVDKNAISALQESRSRVNSMSLLHLNLYQKNQLTNVNMQVYLKQLVDNNFQSYTLNSNKLQIRLGIDAVLLDVDKAIPIGLIINELINNIFKHAFPNQNQGIVSIGFKQLREKYQIEVKDNGEGMMHQSENLTKTKSFGLKLVQLLVKKLNARWQMFSQNGTHILIEVPIN